MKPRFLVPLVLAAAAALGWYWFDTNFERVPVKVKVGLSGEARLRDFLAAERFAERMGLRARELRSLPEVDALARVPKPGAVLLVPRRRQALERERIARLLAWAGRGGHLVVEAEALGVSDPLLDALGVRRSRGKTAAKPLVLELQGSRFSVAFRTALALEPPAGRALASAADKAHVLRHGKGYVTVVASLDFARNRAIGEADHAPFLWALLRLAPARELAVYFRPERLSLWGFLTEHASAALATAALLLAAWLWRIAPRFGPVAPDAPPARRRLLDHLRASGRYYWAQGLRGRLAAAARDAALRRVARAQPDFAEAPQSERASRLAALIGVSSEEALRFLAAGGPLRGADFIRVTQHAQRIHSTLEKGQR